MNADELAQFLYAEGQRWLAAHDYPTSKPWEEHSYDFCALHAAVAEAVLRELGCPAPLAVDAWSREPPQADGYYWFRWDHDFIPAVVKVFAGQARIHSEWRPLAVLEGEWCGPLVPPGEGESETP